MSFGSNAPLEPGPIQRLLIVHLKLAELCTGGGQLDESASTEELCEQILYFYSFKDANSSDNQTCGYDVEEAIEFIGLCSALYSLPSSIDPIAATKGDRTREVYLENCTLVMEVLENNSDIIAVAQVERRSPHHDGSRGGTPSAVAAAIQRSHRLFCLLRGGGVRQRLVESTAANGNGSYDGMKRIYSLRKQARRIREKAAKHSPSANSMTKELQAVERDMAALLTKVPIRSLREDLRVHYDAFLDDLTLLVAENGGPCRCLVQALPAPIALPDGSHEITSAPSVVNPNAPDLGSAIEAILEDLGGKEGSVRPRLLFGVSVFARGQFALTRMVQSEAFVSNETASALMAYLAAFRFEMAKQQGRQTNSGSSTPPRLKQSFRPLAALSFGTGLDQTQLAEISMASQEGFLAPPSLSLLCPSDEGHDFAGLQEDDRVWAPLVNVPLSDESGSSSELPTIETRVCLYDNSGLSFLLYILPVNDGTESDSSYEAILHEFSTEISTVLARNQSTTDGDGDSSVGQVISVDTRPWEQPGREIVFVDRSDHSLVLFSHCNREANNRVASERSTTPTKKRFFMPSAKASATDNRRSQRRAGADISSFDCRHLLASHLSLDSFLAFEDAMDEGCQSWNAVVEGRRRPIETCTFLPHQGWMYAIVDGERELYVLFDSTLFVTVADVQDAALRIWKGLVSGWTD